jgi:hypothetical protein
MLRLFRLSGSGEIGCNGTEWGQVGRAWGRRKASGGCFG